jgi:ParB family transcriptional regulator, chromosome partitioning protein
MANREPRGLGKGLSALLGEAADIDRLRKPVGYVNKEIVGDRKNEAASESADIVRIPIDLISPNPFQPRMSFDSEALEELAASIRSLGLIQPITVRKTDEGKYQIISGERRYRACRIAGMDMIPAYIRSASKQGMLEMAIVENIQRENLDPIETALSYQRLIDECDLTQEQMALRVGKKRASITNYLRLLKLPDKVQHDLKVGLLSVGHAKVILGVEDPAVQQKLCDLVIKEDLSVRQLEEKLKTPVKPEDKKNSTDAQKLPDEYYRMLEHIGKFFPDRISLKRSASGKGSMTVKFNSDEEVRKFIEAMEKAGL